MTTAATAVAAAAVAGVFLAIHHPESGGRDAHAAQTSTAPGTPTPTPARTTPTQPTPPTVSASSPKVVLAPAVSTTKPRPKPLRLSHQYVAAAAPNAFRYHGPGYTVRAYVCGMNYVRPLDPPGEQHHTVCWVQHDFGYAPGTAGRGTTYVLGHAWAEDPAEVLNPVSARVTAQVLRQDRTRSLDGVSVHPVTVLNGDTITLRTGTGVLRYTVRSAYAVNKSQAGFIGPLMDQHTRHRVVLITCAELGGVDYDYNIIVNAYLSASRAFRT